MKILVFLCVVVAVFAVREPVKKTCREKPETGLCKAYMPSYYYDPQTGTCKEFIYGGCGGNGNRYQTEEDCLNNCFGIRVKEQSPDVCTLEKVTGPCKAYFRRYYYDQNDGSCKRFIYGGCQGNGNNFETSEECEATCRSAPQAALDRHDCDKAPDAGLCDAYMPRYYYDEEAGVCKEFVYGGCGGNRNNFRTEEECYNKCGALRSPSQCEQEKEVGPCKAAFRRYYYNKQSGECELFIYGGCAGNDNNFHTKDACEAVCVAPRAPRAPAKCHLKPETGVCRGYFQRYYYDAESDTCKTFVYGGCGGNENNFETEGECLDVCSA